MEQEYVNRAAVEKLKISAVQANVCMLITIDSNNEQHTRPMAAITIDYDGCFWFFASKSSGKLKDISAHNTVRIVYANSSNHSYMEVEGPCTVVCDRNDIQQKWKNIVTEWFPQGLNDPELCLIRLDVQNAFYWDAQNERIECITIKTTTVVETQSLAA
jgi:general stress protein 26